MGGAFFVYHDEHKAHKDVLYHVNQTIQKIFVYFVSFVFKSIMRYTFW
jgi:hypothetical protein